LGQGGLQLAALQFLVWIPGHLPDGLVDLLDAGVEFIQLRCQAGFGIGVTRSLEVLIVFDESDHYLIGDLSGQCWIGVLDIDPDQLGLLDRFDGYIRAQFLGFDIETQRLNDSVQDRLCSQHLGIGLCQLLTGEQGGVLG